MSHLILKPTKGGYQTYDKHKKSFVGPVMKDREKAEKYTEERDKREDKIIEESKWNHR